MRRPALWHRLVATTARAFPILCCVRGRSWHDARQQTVSSLKPAPSDPHRDEIATRIARLEQALQELEGQRCSLQAELDRARADLARVAAVPRTQPASKGSASSPKLTPQEKVALFRRVFRGREDVFPVRFVSKKTGKSGYSPECSNKFVDGLCDLRTTKCSECRNRAYRPLDDAAIVGHLEGRHVIGVYPMLPDEWPFSKGE